eukprot:GEMP01017342.1.p1 GENE.GEMP01017342.1~~GEMP01017342.1.p1  ORF type:complete len:570 (+),score=113.93 GEMP01017342.1:28-1710(+)
MFYLLLVRSDAWSVSSIPLAKLRNGAYHSFVRDTLSRDGLLFVTDISRFPEASDAAFGAIEKCDERTLAATNSRGVFSNFVSRRLAATDGAQEQSTHHGIPFNGPAAAISDVELPATLDSSCDMLMAHEFRYLVHRTGVDIATAMGPRAVEFIKSGMHKEQFHRYKTVRDRLPPHTDAGVFLAMTSQCTDNGGVHLRAVPHAPIIPENMNNATRFWYGEMFLPSEDFYIRPHLKMRDWYDAPDAAEVGCLWARQLADARVECGNDKSLCWMACIPNNSTCRNETSGGICEPQASSMHHECMVERNEPPSTFCVAGMDTDMFMQGFSSLLFGSKDNGCLVFFFPGWTVNSWWKFALAFMGYFAIGLSSEILIAYRRTQARKNARSWMKLASYALNVWLGYIVMLGAMTYAYEMFFATIAGLTVGHAYYNMRDKSQRISATTPCCASRGILVAPAASSSRLGAIAAVAGGVRHNDDDADDAAATHHDGLKDPLVEQLVFHLEGHEGRITLVEETVASVGGVTECFLDCCDTSRMVVHTNGNVEPDLVRERLARINVRCQLPI